MSRAQPRSKDSNNTHDKLKRDFYRGQFWFDDGNIILLTHETPTAFRVHRGVLARHSEIFQDMLNIAPPTATDDNDTDTDTYDGCPIIPMHDLPVELGNLIEALYDGPSFKTTNLDDFFYLAGILRLATKYFIAHLRQQAIAHLCYTWTYTLHGHDEMVERALSTPNVNKMTYPYVHPLHVLNLARETHIDVVLPSVFYFLSLYKLEDLLSGDHVKLMVDHPSRPSSTLSSEDITQYTIVFQRRIEQSFDFIRRVCGNRKPSSECTGTAKCTRAFTGLTSRLSRSWMMRTALLHYVVQVTREVSSHEQDYCHACRRAFQDDCDAFREEMWKGLPELCGLPPWEELVSDLNVSSSSP